MVNSTKRWNPPTAQLALWKSYMDKHGGHLKIAHDQIPEPKPSYAIFIKIMNTAFGLSPLQLARKNKINNTYGNEVRKQLTTVQPFKTAPAVPLNGVVIKPSSNDKLIELIWSAIRTDNMNGDEFKGFVKGLFTMNELK